MITGAFETYVASAIGTGRDIGRPSANRVTPRAHRLALLGVILLAALLHLYNLDKEGFANLYYAATVKSMLLSAHNFFYAAYDPGGFVSVDKPPLGFWVQAFSAALLGFNGFALLLPQAFAGILSVALLHRLTARAFGAWAGVVAALVLALTPISVAANRNNTMDAQLVLTSLLAAWAVSLATERGKLRWLLLGAGLVGIGFNIKMLQGIMALPALWLIYLVASRVAWWKRIAHLAAATLLLAGISLAWPLAVDATPAGARPFVGSSRNNTVMELIVGHNGLARLGQISGWLGLRWRAPGPPVNPPPNSTPPAPRPQNPPAGLSPAGPVPGSPLQALPGGLQPPSYSQPHTPSPNIGGQPPAPNNETGDPGPWRLFNRQLVGQASWLLPLAGLGFIVAAGALRPRNRLARPHQQLLLWAAWLVPQLAFFSFAGLFHRYYLEMLSPAIAALAGAGITALWRNHCGGGLRWLIAPVVFLAAALAQVAMLGHFPAWSHWLTPPILGLTLSGALALIVLRRRRALAAAAMTVCLAALLIAPAVWSLTPIINGGDSGLPFAGPELLERRGRGGIPGRDPLVDFLQANRNGATYLVATLNANAASPIILATGQPVMALGGFGGNDNLVTVDRLARYVADNTVRFFWLPQEGNQQANLVRWVRERCTLMPFGAPPRSSPGNPPQGGGPAYQLYRCAPPR